MNKLTLQHKLIIFILFVIALNAATWFFGLDPSLKAVRSVKATFDNEVKKEEKLRQRLADLRAIDVFALANELEEMKLLIPENGMLPELIIELEEIAGDLKIRIANIQFGAPGVLGDYSLMSLNLNLTGSYLALYDYIMFLESHPRMLLVDSFNLVATGTGDLSSNIQIIILANDFRYLTPPDQEAPGRDNPFGSQ